MTGSTNPPKEFRFELASASRSEIYFVRSEILQHEILQLWLIKSCGIYRDWKISTRSTNFYEGVEINRRILEVKINELANRQLGLRHKKRCCSGIYNRSMEAPSGGTWWLVSLAAVERLSELGRLGLACFSFFFDLFFFCFLFFFYNFWFSPPNKVKRICNFFVRFPLVEINTWNCFQYISNL